MLEDQERHRLAHINGRLAERAEQIARIEFGNTGTDFRQLFRGHHHRRLCRPVEARKVHAEIDMRCIAGAHEDRVRGCRRPSRQVGRAKIGSVELGAGYLGDAVDAARAIRCRIPIAPPRQRRARRKARRH